jgi:predicted ArsR family transcriptional regulator
MAAPLTGQVGQAPRGIRPAIARRLLREGDEHDVRTTQTSLPVLSELPIPLERDVFTRTLLRELAGTLQDVVGLDEASGFIAVVGQRMGDQINQAYRDALAVENLTREQVAGVLVDLKRRIQGDFYVIEQDDEKIVLGNRACPFADKVKDRPALCMMTSNVFGTIAAQNLGYGMVVLEQTIALGHPGCRVVVHLKPTPEANAARGREYFKG